ncbi:MAG TPA: cytochrome C oxidase subunit III, partial [Bacteroidales bacterium]|nr:cytochrome C oxidase subunit III [Bacteroidales bacterium]
ALFFLVNKYFEWSAKIGHDLYPGSELFKTLPPGEGLFYLLYYFSTGLHAFHVIVGGILLAVVARAIKKGEVTKDRFVFLENAGLYWHLVDLIWIFLFPLYYLIT